MSSKAITVVGRREKSLLFCHPGSELRLTISIDRREREKKSEDNERDGKTRRKNELCSTTRDTT